MIGDSAFEDFRPVSRNDTLAQQIARVLRERITGGSMRPGDRMPTEQQLAESFQVSRTVIREAVSSLKHEGLIDTRQGAGAFVSEITRSMLPIETGHLDRDQVLSSVFETRLAIEPTIAALAAERREDPHLEAMRIALDRMQGAIDGGDGGTEAEIQFHRAMAHATGNPYFIGLSQAVRPTMLAAIRRSQANADNTAAIWQEHEAIFVAIKDRAPLLAKKAARNHLAKSARRLSVDVALAKSASDDAGPSRRASGGR